MTRKVYQADFGSQADLMVLSPATNPIINGGFNVWQRGTSFAAIADTAYGPDRFVYGKSGTAVHTLLRSTDVPAVAALVPLTNYSMHLDVTTADASITGSEYILLAQNIEGYNWAPFAQKQFTVGFWVKDTITGVHCLSVTNVGQDRSCVIEYTVNVADTWEYKTCTFPASPSAGAWGYTTGVGASLAFILACGPTYQTTAGAWQTGLFYGTANQVNGVSSTANNFKLWGVTMGLGSTVAPFWPRSFGQELALCQRYCQVFTAGAALDSFAAGHAASTTTFDTHLQCLTVMRTTPTLSVSAASDFVAYFGGTAVVCTAVAAAVTGTPDSLTVRGTVAAGLTAANGILLAAQNVNAKLTLSAEL